jgi:hypothetical protein
VRQHDDDEAAIRGRRTDARCFERRLAWAFIGFMRAELRVSSALRLAFGAVLSHGLWDSDCHRFRRFEGKPRSGSL